MSLIPRPNSDVKECEGNERSDIPTDEEAEERVCRRPGRVAWLGSGGAKEGGDLVFHALNSGFIWRNEGAKDDIDAILRSRNSETVQ